MTFAQRRWVQEVAKQRGRQLYKRPPVVTIMGHVDHGKTTLLDNLRNSQIVKQEFGGITQHIGAFVVPFKQKGKTELVTFLDTPGHAAFAEMRQRGANLTDIVVLVVACDDGVLDQTAESIKFAQNSKVPIIVAINKIDKYTSEKEVDKSIDLIRKQLMVHNVITEAEGGDVQLVKISALNGIGVEYLKEAILALAETLELQAEINCRPSGRVIESQVDQHRGKLCTVLVQEGQLRKGDVIVAGTTNWARVRALFDERQQLRQVCDPGLPIQVTGWREEDLPSAGDPIVGVESEPEAKKIMAEFRHQRSLDKANKDAQEYARRSEQFMKLYREKLSEKREAGRRYGRIFFSERGKRLKESVSTGDEERKINLVLKCDVDGSLEAILNLLDTYDKHDKQLVKLDVMHYGVGSITDNDLVLASSFANSVIYGFNVTPINQKILPKAKQEGVPVRLFNVIYHLYDDLKLRLAEKLPELEREVEIGRAVVIQEFVYREHKRKIHIAGCRCSRGVLRSDSLYKLLRNNELLGEGFKVRSLKHLKDEVKEIEKDRECGISLTLPTDINDNGVGLVEQQAAKSSGGQSKASVVEIEFKPGDTLIAYTKQKYKPKLKWEAKGFA